MSTSLHGSLHVWVNEVTNLPNFSDDLQNNKPVVGVYVTMKICGSKLLRTAVFPKNTNPLWNEHFTIDVAHEADDVIFEVNNALELGGNTIIGEARVTASVIISAGTSVEGWFDVNGINIGDGCKIFVRITYVPASIAARVDCVENAYFAMTTGNDVTLYQDAHATANPLYSNIILANGKPYEPRPAWQELAEAIEQARKFIYITDCSFTHVISLIRNADFETIGEMLKRKADKEGVHVLIMISASHHDVAVVQTTHDVKTMQYFDGTHVTVVVAEREKQYAATTVTPNNHANQTAKTVFTHHQNTIVVDAPITDTQQRKVVAFLGGIGLATGRWDTQEHPLFAADWQEFQDDFCNSSSANSKMASVGKCYGLGSSTGPRLPWHDTYCRIDGPAALDVLKNFEERWTKQANAKANLLFNRNPNLFPATISSTPDDEKWHVQIVRSINDESAIFDSTKPLNLKSTNETKVLWTGWPKYFGHDCKRGRLTERSIYQAYVHLIRKAQRFIYIETQYFNGGSFVWPDAFKTDKSRNILPIEIVNKIGEKIKAGERFAVYVVLPMRPEGLPNNSLVLDKLLNQRLTMKMMYTKIAEFIKSAGIDAHPTDYLNFYFLGKREPKSKSTWYNRWAFTQMGKVNTSRRFMINVHSKTMIVDDTYVIISSADINQRSMGGNRNTEIGMLAYQAAHKYEDSTGALPRGEVHGMRMGLWAEHTHRVSEEFYEPSSLECVRLLNVQAESNLEKYCQKKACELDGHLIKYPISVSQDGVLSTLPKLWTFPDSNTPIFGNRKHLLPQIVST